MNQTRRVVDITLGIGLAAASPGSSGSAAGHAAQPASAGTARGAEPRMPRVDVHAHIGGDTAAIGRFLELRQRILELHDADLAMWIDLGTHKAQVPDRQRSLDAGRGRVLSCIADYTPHDGPAHPPEQLAKRMEEGYLGYKIWAGPHRRYLKEGQGVYRYIDDPMHVGTFAELERLGMVVASIHIADPNGPFGNRTPWMPDPVEYWREINAWRNVLVRHPGLKVVAAHANWLICQDAQLDYLRNLLATFPGLSIDLAATFQYFHLLDRANLRDFLIQWADRILFGTDVSALADEPAVMRCAEQYQRCFRMLETGGIVEGGFFSMNPAQGLELPRDVLEKIYYRNAARIYPRVRQQLTELGYQVA